MGNITERQENCVLCNHHVRIELDATSGGLVSLYDRTTGRQLIHGGPHPLYRLVLARPGEPSQTVTSCDARSLEWRMSDGTAAEMSFSGHGDLDLSVTCSVRLASDSGLAHWRIAVENPTDLGVRTMFYPVVVAPPSLAENGVDDCYVSGAGFGLFASRPGRVLKEVKAPVAEPEDGVPAIPTNFCRGEYPGPVTVQMQAYYGPYTGLYSATYDSGGHVKRFGYTPSDDGSGLEIVVEHHYDERPGLSFTLPYDTVTGVFHGDWYDAADLYKAWAHRQHWCAKKLGDRDVPAWFLEPRPHLMPISRGGADRAQATLPSPPSEFPLGKVWPARKLVPICNQYAEAFESPVVCWLEGWEKIGSPGGPVDIFPPYEGAESFTKAIHAMRRDGHIVSLYLAALHWCYRRASTGYYGEEKFEREGKHLAAVNADGEIERYVFTSAQKHFVNLCVGAQEVHDLYVRNFTQLMDYGATWVQLDQQIGMYTHPCYSDRHGHPVGYGPWMYHRMLEFIRRVRMEARRRDHEAAFSCENACEIWIQEMDAFMDRPYLCGDGIHAIPIFEYVYHEYAIAYGGDVAQWLHHVDAACIKHATCCVMGLQNLICISEPDYDLDVVEVEHPVIPLLRHIVQAQRTFAREFLVFGAMLRPAGVEVQTIPIEYWWPSTASKIRMVFEQVPCVKHGSWRAQNGAIGHILVNWTGEPQAVTLTLQDAGAGVRTECAGGTAEVLTTDGRTRVTVPSRAVVLVEEIGS